MNPRKRRIIARAIMSGIPSHRLNNTTIRAFLESEKTALDLNEDDITSIVGDDVATVEAIAATVVTNTTEHSDLESEIAEVVAKKAPIALKATFSMKNTKKELLLAASNLGLEFKNSFSKSKLLELINNQ